jgi:HEAT repeat protein
VEPAPPPAPEPPARDTALARARAVLTPLLAGDPSRIQRLAAAALSRTGDAAAQATLVRDLAAATTAGNELEQLEIEYALARVPKPDPKWSAQLAAALNSQRRDVKAEAARRLALLGDARAVPMLLQFLDISQTKLSAAEQLAYLAEPHGLKALEQIHADAAATPDDRARAAIALGRAAAVDVAEDLKKLLTDSRFNAFAAAALAHLHDPAAHAVLVGQLDIPSLRVNAARALRELDPSLDPSPLLGPLVSALDRGKDTEQVQAAEAILLLTGDADWAKHE